MEDWNTGAMCTAFREQLKTPKQNLWIENKPFDFQNYSGFLAWFKAKFDNNKFTNSKQFQNKVRPNILRWVNLV